MTMSCTFVSLLLLALVGPGLGLPNGVLPAGPLNIGYYEVRQACYYLAYGCLLSPLDFRHATAHTTADETVMATLQTWTDNVVFNAANMDLANIPGT